MATAGLLTACASAGSRLPLTAEIAWQPEEPATRRCLAAIDGDGRGRRPARLIAACSDLMSDEVCRAALIRERDEAPPARARRVLEICRSRLCPEVAAPRPVVCGSDLAAVTPEDLAAGWAELHERSLRARIDGDGSWRVARALGKALVTPAAVAFVNGRPISQALFESMLAMVDDRRSPGLGARRTLLRLLVDEELVRQALKAHRITVSEEDLERELSRELSEQDRLALGLVGSRAGPRLRRLMVSNRLGLGRWMARRGLGVVADHEVRDYYARHAGHYKLPEQLHLSHILVRLAKGAPRAAVKEARARVEAIRKALRRRTFDTVARTMSDAPERGGDLGFVPTTRLTPALKRVAARLTPGQVSGPVRTRFGFHLILVHDVRPARTQPLEEVAGEIRARLVRQQLTGFRRTVLERLRKDAVIEITGAL